MELKLTATETAAIRKAVNAAISIWSGRQKNGGPWDPETIENWLVIYNGILDKLDQAKSKKGV